MKRPEVIKRERLEELFSQQLEKGLSKGEQKELDTLLQDHEGFEMFAELRSAAAEDEIDPDIDWKKVDAAVLKKFHFQSLPVARAIIVTALIGFAGTAAAMWALQHDWNPKVEKHAPAWQRTQPLGKSPMKMKVSSGTTERSGSGQALPDFSDLKVTQGPKGMDISVKLASAAETLIEILNPAGSSIRILYEGELSAGLQTFVWEGLNSQGLNPGSGLYTIRVRSGGRTLKSNIEIYSE